MLPPPGRTFDDDDREAPRTVATPARAQVPGRHRREAPVEPEPAPPVEAPLQFGEGILSRESQERTVARFHAIEDRFATDLASPEERIAALQQIVNAELQAIGAPPVTVQAGAMADLGRFYANTWQIQVNPSLLTGPVDRATFSRLVNTLVHEARHCEQWYTLARTIRSDGGRAGSLPVPPRVLAAVWSDSRPMSPQQMEFGREMASSMQSAAGQARMLAVYEAMTNARNEYDRVVAEREALRANETWLPNVTAEQAAAANERMHQAHQRFLQAYEAYHSSPHEADAHRAGDTAQELYRRTGS